jgi:hypothetical protein
MASGTNPRILRHQAHNMSATSSVDNYPGTPWHEDDEQSPLLPTGDTDRAPYSGTPQARSYNFVSLSYFLHF